ncbi:MAG TPA: chemotaxis protein CheX [bacterium]|jgi:chemotaxis protein CheX
MSLEVALIDFPRLQEQIATRLLAQHNANVRRVDHNEAAARLDVFDLALFFWPDTGADAPSRLMQIRANESGKDVPIVLVTSESGRRNAEASLGRNTQLEFLVTPLQPQLVARKLAAMLGSQKEVIQPAHLDAEYVNPFITATLDTLKQMADMDCERTGLSVRTEAATKGHISGTMGLSGAAEGFVAITFNDSLARKVVCRMLQMNPGEEKDEDIRDTVGELMNIIAGAAKADLIHTDHSFMLSLPTVIVGGPHSVGQIRGIPVIVIEFTTQGETFEVMVCLMPKKKA